MNDDEDDEEVEIPKVFCVKTKLDFASKEDMVTEVMQIGTAEGAFGNDEPVALLKMVDADGNVVAEVTMPLMEWTMRLVTLLKSTYAESKGKKLDLDVVESLSSELEVKSDNINYIYKR